MPAVEPLPTVSDLLGVFGDAVTSERDPNADVRRGAVYDHFAGVGAILFSREAQRDRDSFRTIYLDTAEGDELTARARRVGGVDRVLSSVGVGTAVLRRPSAAFGQGTFWAGTRIVTIGPTPRVYVIAEDTRAAALDVTARVPIRAATEASGSALTLERPGLARLDDPLWDSTWVVDSLTCADGTDLEPPAALRARVRAARLEPRVGTAEAITRACVAQGAAYVALFASNYGAQDFGLNHCYVADGTFASSPSLLRRCNAALERVRVCGADLQILGMRRGTLDVRARVALVDDVSAFNLDALEVELRDALAASLEGTAEGYAYTLDALGGVLLENDAVADVTLLSPTEGAPLLQGRNFPSVLTRYAFGDVALTFTSSP